MSDFPFQRYWTQEEHLISGGFFADWNKDRLFTYEQLHHHPFLVFLGEPYMGKSTEAKRMAQEVQSSALVDIAAFGQNLFTKVKQSQSYKSLIAKQSRYVESNLRQIDSVDRNDFKAELMDVDAEDTQLKEDLTIFIDSLDEVEISKVQNAIAGLFENLLEHLPESIPHIKIRLFCRVSNWNHSLKDMILDSIELFFGTHLENKDNSGISFSDWIDNQTFHLRGLEMKDRKVCFESETEHKAFEVYSNEVAITNLLSKPRTLLHIVKNYKADNHSVIGSRKAVYQSIVELECRDRKNKYIHRAEEHRIDSSLKLSIGKYLSTRMLLSDPEKVSFEPLETHSKDITYIDDLIESPYNKDTLIFVLQSGLFSPDNIRDGDDVRWSERNLMEFCAAWYLSEKVQLEKLMMLLIHSPTDKIFKQLEETCAFLCDFKPALFENLLEDNYQTLLKADLSRFTEDRKDNLVFRLLKLSDKLEIRDLIHERPSYGYLKTANTQNIIAQHLKSSLNLHQMILCIEISDACDLYDLANEFLTVYHRSQALYFEIQVRIIDFLSRSNDPEVKAKILPCLISDSNENREIMGILLNSYWPETLTVQQLTQSLTKSEGEGFSGSYDRFLRSGFLLKANKKDYHALFEWLSANYEWFLGGISSADLKGVLEFVEQCIQISEHDEIMREDLIQLFYNSDDFYHYFHTKQKKWGVSQEAKQKLVLAVLDKIVSEECDSFPHRFVHNLVNEFELMGPQDLLWLFEWIKQETPPTKKYALLEKIFMGAAWSNREEAKKLFIDLDLSTQHKKLSGFIADFIQEKEHILPKKTEEKPQIPEKLSENELTELKSAIEEAKNNFLKWHYLCLLLISDKSKMYYPDKHIIKNWKWNLLPPEIRYEVVHLTFLYVDSESIIEQLTPFKSFIQNKKNNISISGLEHAYVKALSVIIDQDSILWTDLSAWSHIGPMLIFYRVFLPEPQRKTAEELIKTAFKEAPEPLMKAFLLKVKRSLKEDIPYIDEKSLINELMNPEFLAYLEKQSSWLKLSPEARAVWQRFLIKQGSSVTKQKLIETSKKVNNQKQKQNALYSNAILLEQQNRQDWIIVKENIDKSNNRQKFETELLQVASQKLSFRDGISQNSDFSVIDSYALYQLIHKNYPNTEDLPTGRVRLLGFEDTLHRWKNALLNFIARSQEEETINIAERLYEENPKLIWVLEQAKNAQHRNAWTKIKWSELKTFVDTKDAHIVKSVHDLMDATLQSLKRLNSRLQGENPLSAALWNMINKGTWKHKEEEFFSDFIADHLRQDLQSRGIIINREVVIASPRPTQKGERCDLKASTLVNGIKLEVVIEVKGCWNPEWKISQENQLVRRYLQRFHPDSSTHVGGIYLVGWFCKNDTDKKCGCPKNISQSEKQILLKQQAELLNTLAKPVKYFGIEAALS